MALVFQFPWAILPLKQQLLNSPNSTNWELSVQMPDAMGEGGIWFKLQLKVLVMCGPVSHNMKWRSEDNFRELVLSWQWISGIKWRSSVLATSTFLHPLSHLTSLHLLIQGFSLGPEILGLGYTGKARDSFVSASQHWDSNSNILQACRGSNSTPPPYTTSSLPAISKAPRKLTLGCWAYSAVSVEGHCDWWW